MVVSWHGYKEAINTFTFRVKGGITIPPRIRSKAFSLQLDVEIVSTIGNDYLNNKSSPAYSFYGYVVLVFRDFSEIQIPINQPRQRLYYGRVDEAYVNWYQIYLTRNARVYSLGLANLLGQIGQAVGLGNYSVPPADCPIWSGFEELPLRECYVKCRDGIQFKLEVSHWYPVVQSGSDGCSYDPRSGQAGGAKDRGLPPSGSQPRKAANPNDPFRNLPPVSGNQDLLDFSNSKLANNDDQNPENDPTNDTFWVRLSGQYKVFSQSCATETFFSDFQLRFEGDTVSASIRTTISDSCGGRLVTSGDIRSNVDDYVYGAANGDGFYTTEYLRSPNGENPFL